MDEREMARVAQMTKKSHPYRTCEVELSHLCESVSQVMRQMFDTLEIVLEIQHRFYSGINL